MLDEYNNKGIYKKELVKALKAFEVSNQGSSQCKRSVGAGYYDAKKNKTTMCYSGPGMDVHISEYNHESQELEEAVSVYDNNMYDRWDYHNYANLIQGPDGESIAFYVKHTSEMYMIKSPEWEKVVISRDHCCYPSPVVANGAIYVFYSRHNNIVNGNVVDGVRMHSYRSLWYMKSVDSGMTWEEPVKVIDTNKACPLEIDEVYQCGCDYYSANEKHPNRIHIAWTMWGGVNGHAASNEAAYACYLSLEDMKVYSPDGRLIGDWIDYEQMTKSCLVYKTKEYDPKSMKVASVLSSVLKNGQMLVVYGVLADQGISSVRSAIYIDNQWVETIIAENTYTVKDIYRCPKMGVVKIVYAKGDILVISEYNEDDNLWITNSTTKISFANDTDSVQFANFIEDHKKDLQVIVGLTQKGNIEAMYKGRWPIIAYGEEV